MWGFLNWAPLHAQHARLWGVWPGPATYWLWLRGMWSWGPVTNPTARAAASWLCAQWGQHKGAQWGTSGLRVGLPGLGALRLPTARSWGMRPGPAANWLWLRGCELRDPSPTPQRALLQAGFASCRGSTRARGGSASCLHVGRPELGALSGPTARPWGVRPGTATHWLWLRGMWAWGPVTNPTARALASWLCALWGRHEGARWGRLWPACGASGVKRSLTPDSPSLGRAAGAGCPLAVRAGGWAWRPVTNPTARPLVS